MDQKIILVTGSNKGIGFEIIRQLALLGHQAILTSRDRAKGLEAQKKLMSQNIYVPFIELDITQTESVQVAFEKIKSEFGKLDVLVNMQLSY